MITVGIVTRNRPEMLWKCLASLALIGDLFAEVIVVDDTSDVPAEETLAGLPEPVVARLRVVRQTAREGYIVGRNRIVREASTDYVLLMDDDAWLIEDAGVREAVRVLAGSPSVGAVAFAMANGDGSPWDARMQPAPVAYPCVVPSFIGFAHLLRRSLFLGLGGYREAFHAYGEEKEYGLRLLSAGFQVVYLPHARVVHAPASAERSYSRYLRHTIRNDCLAAIYNEPFPLPVLEIPLRLLRYFRMRGDSDDPGGLRWIVGSLWSGRTSALALRKPVSWSTMLEWRRLRRAPPRFPAPAAA